MKRFLLLFLSLLMVGMAYAQDAKDDEDDADSATLKYIGVNGCKKCHKTQVHSHEMHPAFYEADVKKREKIFSQKNLGPNIPDLSPKVKEKVKNYKASIVDLPMSSIVVDPAAQASLIVKLKNCGAQVWPQNLRIECTEGVYQGIFEGVKSLKVGKEALVELIMQAPMKPGKYDCKWKLSFEEDKIVKRFGPKISFEIMNNILIYYCYE